MHIENADALRLWLEACLGRISSAEPGTLAKYVMALIKKDKEEEELCASLDIFLHKNTKFFVNLLYETLQSKSYQKFTNQQNEMDDYLQRHQWKSEYKQPLPSPASMEKKIVQSSTLLKKAKETGDREVAAVSLNEKGDAHSATSFASEKTPIYKSKYETQNKENDYSEKIVKRERCKDYDERGFCLKGELCLYDHGLDPVVVEELNFNVNTARHSICDSIVSSLVPQVLPPPPPSSPPPPPPPPPSSPPPLPPIASIPCGYIPEAYNPEVPGMQNPTPSAIEFQSSYFMNNQKSGIHIPLHNNQLQPNQSNSKAIRAPRELIGVPIQSSKSFAQNDDVSMAEQNLKKRKAPPIYSRLGPPHPKRSAYDESRCTLLLRKVPLNLNKIQTINEHFSKFGTVTHIEVLYGGEPDAALVKFRNSFEAATAYRNSEAIMNNRFIKVFYHTNFKSTDSEPCKNEVPNSGERERDHSEIKHNLYSSSNIKIEKKSSVPPDPMPEKSVNYSARGNLVRTVYNPAPFVLKKSEAALKTQKDEKQGTLSKRLELHKKMEECLASKVAHQKVILARLNKTKTVAEKDFLKKTLFDLAQNISSLTADYKKSNEELVKFLSTKNGKLTKKDTERELLDAEIDLYKQENASSSNETAVLLAKVNELKRRAKAAGLLDASHPSSFEKKKYCNKLPRSGLLKKDNRTRTLLVTHPVLCSRPGVKDIDTLKKHFLQFGDLEKVEEIKSGIFTVSFISRKAAELALLNGRQIGNTPLTLSWFENHGVLEETYNGGVDEVADDNLHFVDEDEDEEDNESRSWRR